MRQKANFGNCVVSCVFRLVGRSRGEMKARMCKTRAEENSRWRPSQRKQTREHKRAGSGVAATWVDLKNI
ncbi:hypothetical protein JYU34_003277 [Plutella xylostella]|uniref:Uncharacterized protein n=1 Tax=Plutella xylostella TaxID=51655 RepID=A0ABQ7QZL1_PLUXY|nr:hypothetical protein JYU34_003277 [Plutella xylostella]